MSNTGRCSKCESEISIDAERCPECGYEPSKTGILNGIGMLIAIGILSLSGLITILGPILVVGGDLELSSAAIVSGIFGTIAVVSGFFIYLTFKKTTLTAVNDELT